MTKVWYATFGSGHTHPLTGEPLDNCYTRVPRAEYVEAHDAMMLSVFGRQWAFLYEHADAPDLPGRGPSRGAGVKRFGLREVPFVEPSRVARTLHDEVWPKVAYQMRHLAVFIDEVVRPAEVAHQLALAELRRATAAAVLTPDASSVDGGSVLAHVPKLSLPRTAEVEQAEAALGSNDRGAS